MKITVIQNSAYGHAGLVEKFIAAKGWTSRRTLTPQDVVMTDLAEIADDAVVFLGSRRGVYETHVQWIARQRALMRRLVERSVPVFGICFGAQLLATALDGTVGPMKQPCRGWMENDTTGDDVLRGPWLRWHGDFITLPSGVGIAAADGDIVQAFVHGNAAGVQFHPEISNELLQDWAAYRASMSPSDREALDRALAYSEGHADAIEKRAFDLFEHIFGVIRG